MLERPMNRNMIAFTVILLAITEVLDITIVAVALMNMKGALAASPEQITWTITAYVVASAIFMPLTGFLTARFGRRSLLFYSAIGFGLSSLLCGLSTSLLQMVIFRALQGVCGAILPSLAQSTLLDTFPGKEANKAMALFGIGIMLGPIIGPVLGGIITDDIGWRWIFFINVPLCIIAALLTLAYIPQTAIKKVKNDWTGLVLLAVGVGFMQFVLDKGNDVGWFSAHLIVGASIVSVLGILLFILHGLRNPDNIIDFAVFRDRNYVLGCIAMLFYCAVLLGTFSWLPLWMEVFMQYPAKLAGMLLIPRGISAIAVMMAMPVLLKYCDARHAVAFGCILYAVGSTMMAHYNLLQGTDQIFWPNVLEGAATGFFFVPLAALSYQTLSKTYLDTASGLFNFFRSVGSSIGVALFSTIMTQMAQTNWNVLGQHINTANPQLFQWLNANHLTLNDPTAIARLGHLLTLQGNMIAFNDANWLFAWLSILIVPAVYCIKPKKGMDDFAPH